MYLLSNTACTDVKNDEIITQEVRQGGASVRSRSVVHTASMGTTLIVFDLDAVPAGPTLTP